VASQAAAPAPSPRQQTPPSDIQDPSDGQFLAVNLGAQSLIGSPQAMPGNNELASKALEKFRAGDYDRNVHIAYQESYSAVSYLIEKYGMYRMKEMLESLSKGSDPDQAFRNAFSKTYADFIKEWGKT